MRVEAARKLRVIGAVVVAGLILGLVARLAGLDATTRHLLIVATALVVAPIGVLYATGHTVVIKRRAQLTDVGHLSIIHCTLNEVETIGKVLEESFETLRRLDVPGEVIIADSASTDNTVALAGAIPDVRVVPAQWPFGPTARAGIEAAAGPLVLVTTGTEPVVPRVVDGLLGAIEVGADIAVAELPNPNVKYPEQWGMFRLATRDTLLRVHSDRTRAKAADRTLLRNARRNRLTVVFVVFDDDGGPRGTVLTSWPWLAVLGTESLFGQSQDTHARDRLGYAPG